MSPRPGTTTVDAFGLDPATVRALSPVLSLRWSIGVDGGENLPTEGPALVVFSQRFGLTERLVVIEGLRSATGRFVRPLGFADVAPIGPVLRRLGSIPATVPDLRVLLRTGGVAALGATPSLARHTEAALDVELLTVARRSAAPVVPVAVVGAEWRRRRRLVVGPPVETPAAVTLGPLAMARDAAEVVRAVERLRSGGGRAWRS